MVIAEIEMGSEMGSESLSGPQFLHVKPSVYAGYGPLRAGHFPAIQHTQAVIAP